MPRAPRLVRLRFQPLGLVWIAAALAGFLTILPTVTPRSALAATGAPVTNTEEETDGAGVAERLAPLRRPARSGRQPVADRPLVGLFASIVGQLPRSPHAPRATAGHPSHGPHLRC